MSYSRPLIAVLAVALLAACNDTAGEGQAARSGEVLEGTISDEMLPLDSVQSQPPLADPAPDAEGAEEDDSSAPVRDARPAPARRTPTTPAASATPREAASADEE